MATLYLLEQNTILRKTSDRLQVCQKSKAGKKSGHVTQDQINLEIPCADIDQVMLFGNIQITTQAWQELLQQGIEIALFSYSKRLFGRLVPARSKNIFLRIDQFRRFEDLPFKLKMSKMFVRKKIEGMQTILIRHQKHNPGTFNSEELGKIDQFLNHVEQALTPEQLLGIEGSTSAFYFQLFGRLFKAPWRFNGRNRRPPKDPINAILSFGYVVLGGEIQSLMDGMGLDPFLGFYHTPTYGRPSLALDVLEEFRHILVDRLALNLFNLGIVNNEDFYPVPEGGIYLNASGKKKFFAQYERMMGEIPSATDTADKVKGFRAQLQDRLNDLIQLIRIKSGTVQPYIPGGEDFDAD
jgi:CRISPR-associated protein Cas1